MIEKFPIDSDQYYDPAFFKFAPFELTKEYYPLIGELISIFNGIENDLNESLVTLINYELDEIGWIVISELTYSSKVTTWCRLVGFYMLEIEKEKLNDIEKAKEDFETIEKTLRELGADRNMIAHADWEGMNENQYVKVKTKPNKNQIEHSHIKLTKEEFEKIIERYEKWGLEFSKFTSWIEDILEKEASN